MGKLLITLLLSVSGFAQPLTLNDPAFLASTRRTSIAAPNAQFVFSNSEAVVVGKGTWASSAVYATNASGQQSLWLNQPSGTTYGLFGRNQANSVMTFKVIEISSSVVSSNSHIGICTRLVDQNNFAGMACLSVDGNVFQAIDRVSGTETYQAVTGLSLAFNHVYFIKVDNTSSSSYIDTLYDSDGTTALASITNTFTGGVPATGWQCVHVFQCNGLFSQGSLYDGSGNKQIDSSTTPFYNPLSTGGEGGAQITNGVFSFYSDGSYGTPLDWRLAVGPISKSDCTVTGVLNIVTGRAAVVVVRSDADGNCYNWDVDHNSGVIRLYKGQINNGPTLVNSWPVTINNNTDYPFTCISSGTSLSFTINGVTGSVTDSTYSSGSIGLGGYSSRVDWKTVNIQ